MESGAKHVPCFVWLESIQQASMQLRKGRGMILLNLGEAKKIMDQSWAADRWVEKGQPW
jgi:hypothetical protein